MSTSKLMYSSPAPKTQSAISYGSDRDRALSLRRAKISQLSEKLSNLQHSIDEDQTFKKETFEQKFKVFEDKAIKQQQGDESKFKLLKEQLQKVEERGQNEKIIIENQNFNILELNLRKEIQSEKINRKDYEQKLLKLQMKESIVQDQIQLDKKNIEKKQKKRMLKKLEIEFYNYRRMLKKKEDQGKKEIRKSISYKKIRRFNKKNREKTAQSQMFRMLDKMNSYLNGELNAEKSEKEATEESIINLIDQTCNRVENSLRK
ncbi:unnamed protein product [Paramecium pentaurelia]|uniref:Uncharacterized protein n=1 Tax=Paramecium pentaurelia TaxID=43138 RepID=A0A8S1T3W6_9CILI|nr:unnamed protein product [Paramecium pentaurelia]